MLGPSLHHRIAPDGIERVSEVQLHKCSGSIHVHEIAAGCMYQCLCSPLCTHPQLCLPKHPPARLQSTGVRHLGHQAAESETDCDGPDAALLLGEWKKRCTKEHRVHQLGDPPLRTRFAKSANISARSPPTLSLTRSLRCRGRSPSLPPADPGAND